MEYVVCLICKEREQRWLLGLQCNPQALSGQLILSLETSGPANFQTIYQSPNFLKLP